MVNTKVEIYPSFYASYERNITKKHFPKYFAKINGFIAQIKENPHEMELTAEHRNHELKQDENFLELEGFKSFDVDKDAGWRFLWRIVYKSVLNENGEYESVFDDVNALKVPQNMKDKIRKEIKKKQNACNETKFIFVYVINACFNDHINRNPNIASCSIDYLLRENGIEVDKYSPFIYTKYNIFKYDEYEQELKQSNKKGDSFLAGLVALHEELKQKVE